MARRVVDRSNVLQRVRRASQRAGLTFIASPCSADLPADNRPIIMARSTLLRWRRVLA